jgi:para-nitrobenzyl esterase
MGPKRIEHRKNFDMGFVETETTYGKIRGRSDAGVNIFKGIPYAGQVSGEYRFRRPAELEPWSGVREALELGPPAIQPPRQNEPAPAEDCLFLNVWTPANDQGKRPVMFYNHGGGFVIGSGGALHQDGANLARNFDVVVVQTNHRLGLLGFLYLEELAGPEVAGSGNQGLLDIVQGLAWVNQNIAAFGGDPDNVMIFGESGGGAKTSCLYAMPAAAPYFNKASIESGPGIRMVVPEVAAATTRQVLKALEIAPNNWRKLLDVPASALHEVQSQFRPVPPHQRKRQSGRLTEPGQGGFGPVVDGHALPNHPFDPTAPAISSHKPLMVGWNEDEYTFFAWQRGDLTAFSLDFSALPEALEPQLGADAQRVVDTYRRTMPDASAPDLYVAISSIMMMGLGSIEIAEKKALQGDAPVYLYNFGYKSEQKIAGTEYALGTPHAMDISFKFNNQTPASPPDLLAGSNPDRFIASRQMAELWATFARTGVPAATDVPEWPAYTLDERATMRIDTECEVIFNIFSQELAMWRAIGRMQQ